MITQFIIEQGFNIAITVAIVVIGLVIYDLIKLRQASKAAKNPLITHYL